MLKIIVMGLTIFAFIGCAGDDASIVCARPSPTSTVIAQCTGIDGAGCPTCDNEADLWSPGAVSEGSTSTIGEDTSCSVTTLTNYNNGDSSIQIEDWSQDGMSEVITLTVTTPTHTCTEHIEVVFKNE